MQKKAAALKETLTQQRRTERDMASMRTLAHAMNSVQAMPGPSGPLPPAEGGSTALNGAQGALADLEVEVFKDMVRAPCCQPSVVPEMDLSESTDPVTSTPRVNLASCFRCLCRLLVYWLFVRWQILGNSRGWEVSRCVA